MDKHMSLFIRSFLHTHIYAQDPRCLNVCDPGKEMSIRYKQYILTQWPEKCVGSKLTATNLLQNKPFRKHRDRRVCITTSLWSFDMSWVPFVKVSCIGRSFSKVLVKVFATHQDAQSTHGKFELNKTLFKKSGCWWSLTFGDRPLPCCVSAPTPDHLDL